MLYCIQFFFDRLRWIISRTQGWRLRSCSRWEWLFLLGWSLCLYFLELIFRCLDSVAEERIFTSMELGENSVWESAKGSTVYTFNLHQSQMEMLMFAGCRVLALLFCHAAFLEWKLLRWPSISHSQWLRYASAVESAAEILCGWMSSFPRLGFLLLLKSYMRLGLFPPAANLENGLSVWAGSASKKCWTFCFWTQKTWIPADLERYF